MKKVAKEWEDSPKFLTWETSKKFSNNLKNN